MKDSVVYVDYNSNIPLMGIDFFGVIDRGTNIIEVKPLTLCNLKCKYCFVSAGDYVTNFVVNHSYLIEKIKEIISIKGKYKIEIHIAPYGEILLYREFFDLISELWKIEGIETISVQSNGLLLDREVIEKLKKAKLSRINISLNTLDKNMASYLCSCNNYDINKLLNNINILLESNIDVLIAPVWFPGENDTDIEDIIKYVIELRSKGYNEKQLQLGIQKYLIYKTGRKLKKIRPKSWKYFYLQLTKLEKKYRIKLKLGPHDFNIHKRKSISNLLLKKNDVIDVIVVCRGRWEKECIGMINRNFGIKILLKNPFKFSPTLLGKKISVKVIKANYKDNIITASFPTN